MCKANTNDNNAFLGHLRKVNLCFLGVFCKNGNFIRLKFIEEINSVFQVLYVILMHKDIFRKKCTNRHRRFHIFVEINQTLRLIAAKDNKLLH